MIKGNLHILRQGAAHAGKVHFVRMHTHGFNEKLVANLFGKAHYLILYAWAIARAYTLDFAGIKRRTANVFADNFMGFFICIANPAGCFVDHGAFRFKAEGNNMLVAVLNFKLVIVNAVLCYSCRSAGFKPAQLYAQRLKTFGKGFCRLTCVRPAFILSVAHIDYALKICTGTDNDIMHFIKRAEVGCNAKHSALAVASYFNNLCLFKVKIFLLFNGVLHQNMIKRSVLLSTKAVHRRAFAKVEHAALYHHFVRRFAHFSAKGVNFAHKVTLCRAADGRVTGHIGNFIKIKRKQTGFCPKAGGGKSRFDSGMACSHYCNIIFSRKIFFHAHTSVQNYLPTQKRENTCSITASEAFSPVSS